MAEPKKAQKLNWNCFCCRSAMIDARAFVRLARLPRWCGLISWAKTPSWSSNFGRYVTSALPKPVSPSRNFKSAGQRIRHGFLVYSGGRKIRPGDGKN